jgi:site-specific recombinase XerD
MEQIEIKQLIDQVLKVMSNFNLAESSLKGYKLSAFSPIRSFFIKNGKHLYSKETTDTFIKIAIERLNKAEISDRHFRKLRKAADLLEEYHTTGTLEWKVRTNRSKIKVNDYFTATLLTYLKSLSVRLAPGTVAYLKSNALQFLKFLEDRGYVNFQRISTYEIRDFLIFTSPSHRGSMGNVLLSVKLLFQYLNESGITEIKAEPVLQKSARPRKKVLPCFSHEEVECILANIDTTTAEGKRDYAIIYLASHTGLRCVDIVNLKLMNINWKKDEICITQRKTGQTLLLPIDADTEKVIAEYILTGRPNTESPYVFIRSVAPFTKLSDVGNGRSIMKKCLGNAGITHSPGDGIGFHALQRSMGTWMLEAGVPLTTISQVLGHKEQDSTKQYLSLHYTMLAECALNLQGIELEKEVLS